MKSIFFLLLFFTTMSIAQNSNYKFQHTEKTTAPPAAIWKVWTDVPNWSNWDTGLKSAELEGEFGEGAKGKLIPDKGPKSKFMITEVIPGQSYLLKTKIPFGWLKVQRTMEIKDGELHFTHAVEFTGILKNILGKKFGTRYREMLPEVMISIKKIAEENQVYNR
ncbi:MAG: SRPBCC family protein [Bacteroidota bacterium]